jgi:hypothetical protein
MEFLASFTTAEDARASTQVLPVTSTDLVFGEAPSHEPNVPDRQSGRPRYEMTDSEGTLKNENAPNMGRESLSIHNDPTLTGEPQHSRQSDDDVR